MKKQTLTATEWNALFALPADGNVYCVEGIAFRARHVPQTRVRGECVMAETRYGTIRRRFCNGRWQATEYIANID